MQESEPSIADYAEDPRVIEVLELADAVEPLLKAGLSIAEQLVELLGAVDEDSSLLDSFSEYSKKDIIACAEIVEKAQMKSGYKPVDDERRILLAFALAFAPIRDRLDVIDPDMEARLLAARQKAMAAIDASAKPPATDEFIKGLWRENPVFVSVLGMCPVLAVSNTAMNAIAMGLALLAWAEWHR